MTRLAIALTTLALSSAVRAHVAAYVRGMYCQNSTTDHPDDINNSAASWPLFNFTKSDWWFEHHRGCDLAPPSPGDILDLPAGGSFGVELASNLAFTTLRVSNPILGLFGNGRDDTDASPDGCIYDPNLHTTAEKQGAGSAFAISYVSDISQVTIENLAVFTVRKNTPYHRLASFDVPKDLPPCPSGGCMCAWLWVPDGCGQQNMYMEPIRCNVTGSTSTKKVAQAVAPVYCETDASKCNKGAQQMIAAFQADGNNIDPSTMPKVPTYSERMGFVDGAQNNIFETGDSDAAVSSPVIAPSSSTLASPLVATPVPVHSVLTAALLDTDSIASVEPISTVEPIVSGSSSAPAGTMSTTPKKKCKNGKKKRAAKPVEL